MKKIISLVLALAALLLSASSLISCEAADSDLPDGMQLVRGGDSIGYYMYAPEEWIVENHEEYGIACSYVSKLNNTSVTLVEADFTEAGFLSYYEAEMAKFPESWARTPILEPKADKLGNSEWAMKTVYTYKYDAYTYESMQIFAIYKGRAYIFTYTASAELYDGEVSFYEEFLEKASEVITNLKFVDIAQGEPAPAPEYPKNEDGMSLVSDRSIAGFDLYIPDSYTLDFASSIVSASRADGTNINVSEATGTSDNSVEYWSARFKTLSNIAGEVKIITEAGAVGTSVAEITKAQIKLDLGEGIKEAAALTYTYTLGGKVWRTYQVLVNDFFSGYVFTYTAEEALYEANFAEAQTILYNIEF